MADENNKVIYDQTIWEDLRASEIRYRRLFESALDGILILDAVSRKIIDVNPFMVELSGYSRDELPGEELSGIGLFKGEDESQTAFRQLQATGSVHYEDLALETKAGHRRRVEFIGNLYAEGSRRVIQCNIRDITERKRAEAAREQLAQSASLLAQIAGKAAQLGGWAIELPERTLTWSDENCAIHDVPPGYRPTLEEGIGYFPPEYRAEVLRHVEACVREGTPYDFEFPKYTAKGRLIWVRSIGEAVRDADGRIIRIQGAFQDITVRKQAEEEREGLIAELRKALAEVKELRGIVPICMYCKNIRRDDNFWERVESYVSKHTDARFSHAVCPDCYQKVVEPQLKELKDRP